MRTETRAAVEALVAARNEGNGPRMVDVLAEAPRYWDAVHGEVAGRDAVGSALAAGGARFALETLAASEDAAVAEIRVQPEGGRPAYRSTEVYTVDAGRIVAVRAYVDPAIAGGR